MKESYKRYKEVKTKHPNRLILVKMGAFCETYEEDARTTAEVLGITLNRRHHEGKSIFSAGFPYDRFETFLPRLIRAGLPVGVCELGK